VRKRLVLHFLEQYVENEWAPEADAHQTLALIAAAAVTIPLFATVFMSFRYLIRHLQAAGWTETTVMEDQITFCATSMLVAALVAAVEWDALSLSTRDAVILGVLPVPRREVVAAKVASLVAFVGLFVAACNLLPTLLHPPVTIVTLPVSLAALPVLIGAHALSTTMAAVLGFASVVGLREVLYLVAGRQMFRRVSDVIRSALLLALLVLVLTVPVRLAGRPDWLLAPGGPPAALRPIAWCVAVHASIAGRVLQRLPERPMPPDRAAEERQLRTRYESSLPRLTALAVEAVSVLTLLLAAVLALYLWNARRLYILDEGRTTSPLMPVSDLVARIARGLIRRPATRAGFLFLLRTLLGSPVHRLYLIVAVAVAFGLFRTMAPLSPGGGAPSVGTMHLVAQTLLLTVLIAAFRAAIRTAADERAGWLFCVADTGHLSEFRDGVRLAAIAATALLVVLLLPLHAAAWGLRIAIVHAAIGMAAGWLLVEAVSHTVERPLVTTMPSNDALNTVGAVALGSTVLAVFALTQFELAALADTRLASAMVLVLVITAAALRYASNRQPRSAGVPGAQDRLLRLT
jgi:hypothetical protein